MMMQKTAPQQKRHFNHSKDQTYGMRVTVLWNLEKLTQVQAGSLKSKLQRHSSIVASRYIKPY